jgi:hypothetical protein
MANFPSVEVIEVSCLVTSDDDDGESVSTTPMTLRALSSKVNSCKHVSGVPVAEP